MALNNSLDPKIKGLIFKPFLLTADDSDGKINTIPAGTKFAKVIGVTNGANDYIVLPRLDTVQDGHELVVIGGAGANFEVRTPTTSGEKINDKDGDGTTEYLFTDTQEVHFIKISDSTGWMGHGYTAIGAVVTAVVPD